MKSTRIRTKYKENTIDKRNERKEDPKYTQHNLARNITTSNREKSGGLKTHDHYYEDGEMRILKR